MIAAEQIMEHRLHLVNYITNIVRDRSAAEDIVGDTVLKAFSKQASFRGDSKLTTWLTSIARREALMWMRKQKAPKISRIQAEDDLDLYADPASSTIVDRVVFAERLAGCVAKIRTWTPLMREFMLTYIECEGELLYTCDVLDLTYSAGKARLHRARTALREEAASDEKPN